MPAAADKNAEAAEELVDYEEEEVAEAETAKGKVRVVVKAMTGDRGGDRRSPLCRSAYARSHVPFCA
jgi:hypothetical protein